MNVPVGDMLTRAAKQYGEKRFAVCLDKTLTFSEVNELSDRFAVSLYHLGIRSGDRVTLWIENGWHWIVSYYGVLKLGAVVNPVNVLLTHEEVVYIVNDCESRAIIVGPKQAEAFGCVCASPALIDLREAVGHAIALESLFSNGRNQSQGSLPPAVDAGLPAVICYTSGTTGHPKGAVLRHVSIVTNTRMTSLMHGRLATDTVVSALPCSHVYGNIVLNAAVACGMTIALLPRFDERAALEAIERHRATIFEGVPTMFLKMLNCPEFDQFDVSSLRLCTVGGQTMPIDKMEEVERRFGCPLIELWGMTELGGLGTTHPFNWMKKLGSIGIPLPTVEAKIVDASDASRCVPRGEVGELTIRGPIVMVGYFGNPDATSQAIDSDGWLHTGDLVRQDADGYLFVIDRKTEVILSGGYNIYPAEVERVVAQHPAVAMVAVAALYDELKGHVPKAFVVLRHGVACSPADIVRHCKGQLAAYKVPTAVEFVPDLPKTSTGKVLRRLLAAPHS